jgi:hypothetical protein
MKMDPFERSTYAMGICMMLWILLLCRVVEYIIFKSFQDVIPGVIFIVIALFFMWLFKYVYITQKRYRKILEKEVSIFNVSEKTGILISVTFVLSSFLIPMLVAILLHKMDGSV